MRLGPGWLLVVPLLVAGCGSSAGGQAASGTGSAAPATSSLPPSAAPTSTSPSPAALRTCGAVPVSSGASAASVAVSATAPASATSGSTVQVQLHVRSLDRKRHVLTTGHPSLLVTRQGKVVGEYEGGDDAVGVQILAPSSGDATLSASGLVSGCPEQPVDYAAPDLTRKALPSGSYDVVVVLPDVTAKPRGNLVSAPVPLQVTADPHTLPTCGDVPISAEPPQSRVAGVLTGPSVAKAGSTVRVQVELRSNQGKPERLDTALPVDVLVVRDGSVVGRTDGPVAGVGLTLTVPASGTVAMVDPKHDPAYFGDVTLSGCPLTATSGTTVVSPSPRTPLPPGNYQLVGVVKDNVGGHPGVLVTQPLTVQVT